MYIISIIGGGNIIVKEIKSDNCTVRIHDDCFEDKESIQRRLNAVKRIIIEAYRQQYISS